MMMILITCGLGASLRFFHVVTSSFPYTDSAASRDVSMEPANCSRTALWIESQSAIAHFHQQDPRGTESLSQCSRRAVSSSPKAGCPYQTLQAITPPSSIQKHTSRKRRRSMPATERPKSPRKRLRGEEERGFSPSASSRNITVLDSRTVLSTTSVDSNSSPKRTYSPTRDHAIELRTASPSIQSDSVIGVHIPKRVRELRKLLINGYGRRFVPAGLKACHADLLMNPHLTFL